MTAARRRLRSAAAIVAGAVVIAGAVVLPAQVLLDRVLARVNGVPVTLSDVRGALQMGLIVAEPGDLELATEQWVQRQLLLLEVERFPPPEPAAMDVDREVARLRSRPGAAPPQGTPAGVDERQLRQGARDTLRIRAYLDQRFGESVQVSDEEARAYFASHATDFSRDGVLPPFEQVEAAVRQQAATVRRQATIDQWMGDLRQRSNVVLTPTPTPHP
jgi:hypothetical protein